MPLEIVFLTAFYTQLGSTQVSLVQVVGQNWLIVQTLTFLFSKELYGWIWGQQWIKQDIVTLQVLLFAKRPSAR